MRDLIERIREFNRKRDWEQFHSPKNLAMCLAAEVGELLEQFHRHLDFGHLGSFRIPCFGFRVQALQARYRRIAWMRISAVGWVEKYSPSVKGSGAWCRRPRRDKRWIAPCGS